MLITSSSQLLILASYQDSSLPYFRVEWSFYIILKVRYNSREVQITVVKFLFGQSNPHTKEVVARRLT